MRASAAPVFDAASFDVSRLGDCLVTGASGYLGASIVARLRDAGVRVHALDRLACVPELQSGRGEVRWFVGDIRDGALLHAACEGIQTVFHCAAIIDTATYASDARRREVFAVNLGGTKALLSAARGAGVKRFVYTSSVNVVVDRPYAGADESAAYGTSARDMYTRSKIAAERAVLDASTATMATTALRPGGIYGPGERQHLGRVVREVSRGRYVAMVAGGRARADNVYIDDLVNAQLAAAAALLEGRAAGRAFFISDGEPANYFHFFRPVAEQLGVPFPRRSVPARVLRPFTQLAERWGAWTGERPFLTEMELDKLRWDHFFSIEAARHELGWVPQVPPAEGFARCEPWIEQLRKETDVVERPHLGWWVAIFGGLGLLFWLAFAPNGYRLWRRFLWLPSRTTLRVIAVIAIALHVGEAAYARKLAKEHNLDVSGWTWQTFLLGYPSLRLLLRRVEAKGA
ncbi:MAG: NAD-dependent epimerase/dehydratase family protein [Myxococcota bacterium]